MKTAEEIIKRIHPHYKNPESDFQWIVSLINEARVEAIRECAEVSSKLEDGKFTTHQTLILKLIDQVK